MNIAPRLNRKWICGTALIAAAILLAAPVGNALGRWLVINDARRSARAIVVLSGNPKHRPSAAAAVYRQGLAAEVWLTQGRAISAAALNEPGDIEEHDYSRQMLEAQGVQSSAIILLPGRNADTADEIRTIARHLKSAGGGRVVLMTSKFHTRRVKLLWGVLAKDQEEPIVLYPPNDRFDPDRWWRTTDGARIVLHEYLGILRAGVTF